MVKPFDMPDTGLWRATMSKKAQFTFHCALAFITIGSLVSGILIGIVVGATYFPTVEVETKYVDRIQTEYVDRVEFVDRIEYVDRYIYAESTEPEVEYVSLGMYKVTAYCACVRCCGKTDGITATGTKATEGRTIAADPKVLPYGTKVIINGHEYTVEDCGGAIYGNRIDIYFDSHEEAVQFGVQMLEVFVSK